MTRLIELRKRLSRLRRRRRGVRSRTALSGFLVAALVILAVAFAVDWQFEMSRSARVVLLAACGIAAIWAWRRYSKPFLGTRESELEIALWVERQQGIDTDLIAALEFESPEAAGWGSVELEQAVIDRVALAGTKLNIMRGLPRVELHRRTLWLLGLAAVWGLVAVVAPGHLTVFFQRLALSARHYPTRTVLESITVAGQKIDPDDPGANPIRVFYGQPMRIEVQCAGVAPKDDGRAALSGAGGLQTSLALKADDTEFALSGEWERPADSVRMQLFVGDAWTDPLQVIVAQLPVVELELEVRPPSYAQKGEGAVRMPVGLRQISVVEGSQVVPHLSSDKGLSEVSLVVGDKSFAFGRERKEGGGEVWSLDSPESPLAMVDELTRYSIRVTDADGQKLDRAIEGLIRIQTDAPPRVAAAAVTHVLLPTGEPTIVYRAMDDYGIGRITILREITRAGGQTEEGEMPLYELAAKEKPQRSIEDSVPVDFSQLKLSKGDQVKLTLRAVDYRGRSEGKAAISEPLVFQITDEQGFFASQSESDRHSAQQLKAMIQRQLGIGESP